MSVTAPVPTRLRQTAKRAWAIALLITVALIGTTEAAEAATTTPTVHTAPTLSSRTAPRVTAIGDSVTLDAAPNLRAHGITVDAAVSQQVPSGISEIRRLAHDGRLGHTVVFALGTNGTFDKTEFHQVIHAVHGRHLVVVTAHCPYCSWTASNNAMIHHHCTRSVHCTIADWDTTADHHPNWFTGDGVHMPIGGTGARHYATLIAHQT
jgi:hypothetical protein